MPHELQSFRQCLQRHGILRAGQTALRGAGGSVSYAQLLTEVAQREAWLRQQPPGSLALMLDNGPELLLWDLAALFAERVCVILPPFFSVTQRAHCLGQIQASLLLAEESASQQLLAEGYVRAEGCWRRPALAAVQLPSTTAKVTYTSGSTGSPKGVCLSAAALLRVAAELAAASAAVAPRHYLTVLPVGVLLENLGLYAALLSGASISIYPGMQIGMGGVTQVDWSRFVAAIVASGADSMILAPQLLLGLVSAVEQGQLAADALRFIAVGGAQVAASLLARAENVKVPVFEGYGLSECASVVCLNRPGQRQAGSVGRALPHAQLRIAADGEVLVRGSNLLGYLGEVAFAGDWWPTGDLGHIDDCGYLHLAGRKKHQFITSFGRNVNPEWIEAELTQGGVIAQAFVHGEGLPRNFALLWPLAGQVSDELIEQSVQRCNASLPDYARVHVWRRLSEPFSSAAGTLTSNGRLRRQVILQRHGDLIGDICSGESL